MNRLKLASLAVASLIAALDIRESCGETNAYKHGVFPGYDSIRLPANVVERRAAEVPAVP